MSEGPNVIQWARALRQLAEEPLIEVKLPAKHAKQSAELVGQHVAAVDTHGKHLLTRLSDGRTLNCHGMIKGHWAVGAPGTQHHSERDVYVRLRTAKYEAVFINGPIAELLTPWELSTHPRLLALGPDVMSPEFDRDEAWRRVQSSRCEISEAIVNQTVVAGMGNIYKAEGLFVARIDPRRAAAEIRREELEALWDGVIPLMWDEANGPGPWTTLPPELRSTGERHWVYGRNGRPCLRCRARVRFIRQGRYRRSTFFCPNCQCRADAG